MKAVSVVVTGNVQAVGFRYAARAKANDLGVVGWITNQPDGDVGAFAQGPEGAVDAFVEWMKTGPAGATVAECTVTAAAVDEELSGFQAR